MRTSKARIALVALVVSLFILAAPGVAMAALEDDPTFLSKTNPGVGTDATWRWQWGNDWFPHLQVSSVPADGTEEDRRQTTGFIYEIRQVDTSGTGFVVPTWGASPVSPHAAQSTIEGVYDIGAVATRHGWTPYAGSTQPGEGMYGMAMRFFNQFRVEEATATTGIVLGIDVTDPNPVTGLTTSVSLVPNAYGKWTEARWRDLAWTPSAYDALSGVGGFKVFVDGEQVAFMHNVAPDPAYEPYASLLNPVGPYLSQAHRVTVEDLPAGATPIEIVTVDRATNESVPTKTMAYVDYDTPKIVIKSPAAGAVVGPKPTVRVTASDEAGVSKVEYYVDGLLVGTSTSAPFTKSLNLSGYSNGTHTLSAKVYDMIGSAPGAWVRSHTAITTRSIKLDKTSPRLSNVNGSPSTFYPRKRDGYRDNHRIRFTANKSGTVKVVIKNSSGRTVRTISKRVSKGSSSILWNGKYSDGSVHQGTFRYYLTLTDAGGQTYKTSTYRTKIRFTQLVRVSASRVKVVQR